MKNEEKSTKRFIKHVSQVFKNKLKVFIFKF
jgi:hypothetical protein